MKYFFGLLRKLRAWKQKAKNKQSNTMTSKFSQIIKTALERKQENQQKENAIKKSIVGFLESRKKL